MEKTKDSIWKHIARIFAIVIFFVLILFSSVVLAFKCGIMRGNDVDDILDNIDAYEYLEDGSREIVVLYLDESLSDGGEIVKCVPKGMIRDSIKEMIGALSKNRQIDIYEVTTYKEEFAENICTYTLDQIAYEVEKDGQITKDTIRNCIIIKEIDENLNVQLEEYLIDKVEKYQEKLDFRDSLPPELRREIVEDVSMVINPVMDIFVKEYVQDVNEGINEEIAQTELREFFDDANDYITVSRMVFIVVIITTTIAGFVVFLLYKDKRYKAFSRVGICFAIIGILGFFIGAIGSVVKASISDSLETELVDSMGRNIESAGAFARNIMDTLINPVYAVCSAYLIIGIACIVLGIVGKKKYKKL